MIKELIARIICRDIVEEKNKLEEENYILLQDILEVEKELNEYKDKFNWIYYPIQDSNLITSSSLIRRKVREQLAEDFKRAIIIPDPREKLVDIKHFKEWLKVNPVNKRQYKKDFHDCNTFSTILKGNVKEWDSALAFGEVYVKKPDGGGHALNVLVDTDLKLWVVEPQNDSIFELPEGWIPYTDLRF